MTTKDNEEEDGNNKQEEEGDHKQDTAMKRKNEKYQINSEARQSIQPFSLALIHVI